MKYFHKGHMKLEISFSDYVVALQMYQATDNYLSDDVWFWPSVFNFNLSLCNIISIALYNLQTIANKSLWYSTKKTLIM